MDFIRAFVIYFVLTSTVAAQETYLPQHPMDALTPEEIARTVQILKTAGFASDATRYPALTLQELPKAEILEWKEGEPFTRRAFVISRENNETSETIVDISARKVLSHVKVPGAEPMIMDADWALARDNFMADARFKAALKRRGYADKNSVFCTPNSAGYYPTENYENRRILKVPCYDDDQALHPLLARPIEGLMGVVDTNSGEVLDVIDHQIVPLPAAPQGYGGTTPEPNAPAKRVEITNPDGTNIKLSGNIEIAWDKWSFHIRADKRAGVILSLAKFDDGANHRLIAYQMNISEMFVPYMDPDPTWRYRTFLDAGEFGLGYLISSLEPEIDCPPEAIIADLTFPDDVGGTYTRPKALCIFERATGDPAWRHYSSGSGKVTGRAETELVVRHIPTLGNYDYIVDYVFAPRGSITLRVGATGFDAIKSSAAKDMESESAIVDSEYGYLIAPYTIAPNHDHYFSYRLDLDVDGSENVMLRDAIIPEAIANSAVRKSLWRVHTKTIDTEGPIEPDHMARGGEAYRLSNPNQKTNLKYNPSYWIDTHHQSTSILDPTDPPQTRANFSAHSLWVTKYKPDELWAAGAYPNLSRGGDGLPQFVEDQEAITNTDIVIWYTMGFRHTPKPEDFPILPVFWHEMTLRPAYFFDRDPSSKLNAEFEPSGQE